VPLLVSLQRISKIRTRISIERSRIGAQRFQSLLHRACQLIRRDTACKEHDNEKQGKAHPKL